MKRNRISVWGNTRKSQTTRRLHNNSRRLLCAGIASQIIASSFCVHAQEFPTTGNQYIWKVGNGLYNNWQNNYSYNGGAPTSAPNAARDVIFGWSGVTTPAVVSLDPEVPANGSARSFNVYGGTYTFDFNGVDSSHWNKIWRFGNGIERTAVVHFMDSTNAAKAIQFTNLVIGDNGSSNNIFGGANATITFDDNVSYSFSSTGTLTVGSTVGGSGNEFHVSDGESVTRGAITLQGANNRIVVDGGSLYGGGGITIGGSGDSGISANNEFLIHNGGTVTTSGNVMIEKGSSFKIEGENASFSTTEQGRSIQVGGILTVNEATVNAAGIVVNGGSAEINNANITGALSVSNSGKLAVTDSEFSGGGASVNTGGEMTLQGDYRFENNLGMGAGVLDLASGSRMSVQNMTLAQVGMSEQSQVIVGAGSELEVRGKWTIGVYGGNNTPPTYDYTNHDITIEEGGLLKVYQFGLGYKRSINELKVNGLVALGEGGIDVTGGLSIPADDAATRLHVKDGTRLRLDNTTVELGSPSRSGMEFRIENGASLEGTGTVGQYTVLEVQSGGLVNPGINNGRNGEAGTITLRYLGQVDPGARFAFDVYDVESYDKIRIDDGLPLNMNGAVVGVSLWEQDVANISDFDSLTLIENISNPSNVAQGTVSFEFDEDSKALLASGGLAWDVKSGITSSGPGQDRWDGTVRFREVAQLEFNTAPKEMLGNGADLTVSNQLAESSWVQDGKDAEVVSTQTSNAGWAFNGISAGDTLTNPNSGEGEGSATGTVAFATENALNGTHTGTLRLTFDLEKGESIAEDIITHEWKLSHTVSGQTADFGVTHRAYVDGGSSYAGFGLEGFTGNQTVATLLGGEAGGNTELTMSFRAGEGSGLVSDVLSLNGSDGDVFVLSLTYNVDLVQDGDSLALGWLNNGEWVLAVDGNSTEYSEFISGAWTGDLTLGLYGWDVSTNTVWAVLDHNSDFAVVGAIPEPSTYASLAIGAGLLGCYQLRRRRRSAQAA